MTKWHSIKDVPVNTDVDVWAVREVSPSGEAILDEKRWPDVRLVQKTIDGTERFLENWQGLPQGWTATHWRGIPKGPRR